MNILRRPSPFLLVAALLAALLTACFASGPQKALNSLAEALNKNDSAAFLAQLDLKTFAANTIRNNDDSEQTRADIARAFEDAVVDTLMIKCKRALDQTGFKRLVMAGGVSANRTLRAKLAEMMQKRRGEVFYARPEFCTDNGAMIAYAGMVRLNAGATSDLSVSVRPRWPLAELPEA